MYERMEKPVTGDIYKISVWYKRDEEYCETGYFGSFGMALSIAQEMRARENDVCGFKIEKIPYC